MIFFISVEVDEYKTRYTPQQIIESACDSIVKTYDRMGVTGEVVVPADFAINGLKS